MLSRPEPAHARSGGPQPDLRDIKGQESAKRALEIAAAGGHNLLMTARRAPANRCWPQRLPSILPPLTPRELLEISMIHSVAGRIAGGRATDRRPFRAPHHSASMAALVGGGVQRQPGEVSLAHNGVLFLDELPEFSAPGARCLRQPIETGEVSIARANHRVAIRRAFQLVAAMNPAAADCRRAGASRAAVGRAAASDYQARISGPLLDRIDIRITVPPVTPADLSLPPAGEGSEAAGWGAWDALAPGSAGGSSG